MLLSMTGFGEARHETQESVYIVELRSVNHRFLKTAIKLPESHSVLEREIDKILRDRVRRGTVSISVRLERARGKRRYRLNRLVLQDYLSQLRDLGTDLGSSIGSILTLPGVIEISEEHEDPQTDWPAVGRTLQAALDRFEEMRRSEGAAIERDLVESCDVIADLLDQIERHVPGSIKTYHSRLTERINAILAEHGVSVSRSDLVREVAIFVERSDISEEVTRLRSHLAQFRAVLAGAESEGRKLEFLSQEMYRESNTLGSKANDVTLSQFAMDLKSHVERVREIVQNVE